MVFFKVMIPEQMNHVVMTKFVSYGGPPSSQVWPQIILLHWLSLKIHSFDFFMQ